MHVLSLTLVLLFLGQAYAWAGGDTNEWTLLKHQGRRQAYEWRISEARIAATPEWNIDAAKVPLPPETAWQIAKAWFTQQGKSRPELTRIEIVPFVRAINWREEKKQRLTYILNKYYYRIECVPAASDSMVVIVLMDGAVLEPMRIPNLPVGGSE